MIEIFVPACGAPIEFDHVVVAADFLRMIAGQIKPDAWLDTVQQIQPGLTDLAHKLVDACLGTPS